MITSEMKQSSRSFDSSDIITLQDERLDGSKANTHLEFVLAAEVWLSQRVVKVHLLTGEGHGYLWEDENYY